MKDKIIALIGCIMFIIGLGFVGYYETHYTMDCIVIDTRDNVVTVVDLTCNEWEFKGDLFQVDDIVKITFNTNGTDNREDDKIKKIEKLDYSWED